MSDLYLWATRVDIVPEKEQAFNEWYTRVHMPQILACPGFVSARRYRAIEGIQRYFAMYEIREPSVLQGEKFQKVRGWYQFGPGVFSFARNVYERISPPEDKPHMSDYLFTTRADIIPAKEQEWNEWDTQARMEILACPGFISARRYRAIEGIQRYFAAYEIREPSVLQGEKFQKVRGWYQFGPGVFSFARNVYERISPPVEK